MSNWKIKNTRIKIKLTKQSYKAYCPKTKGQKKPHFVSVQKMEKESFKNLTIQQNNQDKSVNENSKEHSINSVKTISLNLGHHKLDPRANRHGASSNDNGYRKKKKDNKKKVVA